jgi:hypothetical protein
MAIDVVQLALELERSEAKRSGDVRLKKLQAGHYEVWLDGVLVGSVHQDHTWEDENSSRGRVWQYWRAVLPPTGSPYDEDAIDCPATRRAAVEALVKRAREVRQ